MKKLKEIKKDVEQGQKTYYVYLLFKPDGTPFYVGKGKSNRISAHEAETRCFLKGRNWKGINTFKLNTIKKIWDNKDNVLYQIDSWHDVSQTAGEREIELVEFYGRRVINEGPLVNIRTGGDLMSEEDRKLFGEKIRQHYIDHPEAREAISERMTQFYIDHPEMRDQISQSMKDYIEDNPEFVTNLMERKEDWIKNHPEEYTEAERNRLEICQSDEHRKKVSETMVQYCLENPESLQRFIEQGSNFWIDNEEARESARQRAIDNESHLNIIKWLENEPEACREKWDRHSEYMTQWYQDNPDDAKRLAEDRNKVLRSDSHRKKMSQRTSDYMASNPEVSQKKVILMQTAIAEKRKIKQKCLRKIQQRLFELGKISVVKDEITFKMVRRWEKLGVIEKYFPDMPTGRAKHSDWESFFKSHIHA